MKYLFCAFWLVVMAFGVTFAGLNSGSVVVNYYLDEKSIRLPVLLLSVLAIGVFLGFIAMLPALLKKRCAIRRLRQHVKQIEQEVNNLRAIPIKETH